MVLFRDGTKERWSRGSKKKCLDCDSFHAFTHRQTTSNFQMLRTEEA